MRAVVVGAGMAGLVTARQLGLAGWEVDLIEQSAGPRTDGYMMDFFGPGVEATERIGLHPRLAEVAYGVQAAEYVDADGRVRSRIDYARFARLAGGGVLSLLRPDLERACRDALDDVPEGRVRLHWGTRFAAIERGGDGVAVRVVGAEPRLPAADLVIGADGVHSKVRAHAFGPDSEFLRPLGLRAAAFIVHEPELNARCRDRFRLSDTLHRTAGLYGLREEEVATLLVYRDRPAASVPDPGADPVRERLRREFSGVSRDVDRVLALCPPTPYDDVVAQVVAPRWSRDRVVLVGDACGAVSLLAGQGGSLAIAGAVRLTERLAAVTTPDGIPKALAEYEREWRPVIVAAQASGRRAANTFVPANRAQLFLRRWVIRATRLPGIDRLVARMVLRSIAS